MVWFLGAESENVIARLSLSAAYQQAAGMCDVVKNAQHRTLSMDLEHKKPLRMAPYRSKSKAAGAVLVANLCSLNGAVKQHW